MSFNINIDNRWALQLMMIRRIAKNLHLLVIYERLLYGADASTCGRFTRNCAKKGIILLYRQH